MAATGTGKTMLAGFDYARQPDRPNLLFLAHREELLRQARTSFRHILRDGSFGELLTGTERPGSASHLFGTIQSFARSDLASRLGADHWKYVVIDEAHRAPADSYQDVLARLRPRILLGLTAPPERTDNQSLLPDFDGAIAAEMRLWHALEKQLVVPFENYGSADETDFTAIEWRRGGYDKWQVENLLTGNDRRAELVAAQFRRYRGAWRQARALAFCVTVGHAEFMTEKFKAYGIPAMVVHGDTNPAERVAATRAGTHQCVEHPILRSGEPLEPLPWSQACGSGSSSPPSLEAAAATQLAARAGQHTLHARNRAADAASRESNPTSRRPSTSRNQSQSGR